MRDILVALGEDPAREGLERTPARVAAAWRYLTGGYSEDPDAIINGALFNEDYQEMIVEKDIDFYSLCEHHMLPFHGKAHVAYIPRKKIVGVSKLARLVDAYARRLQVQERLDEPDRQHHHGPYQPLGSGGGHGGRAHVHAPCAAFRNKTPPSSPAPCWGRSALRKRLVPSS